MIYFLVFIAGLLLACMQSFNGLLSNYIGTYGTSLIVHCIGAVMLLVYLLIKKERIRLYPMPWYLYSARDLRLGSGGFYQCQCECHRRRINNLSVNYRADLLFHSD